MNIYRGCQFACASMPGMPRGRGKGHRELAARIERCLPDLEYAKEGDTVMAEA